MQLIPRLLIAAVTVSGAAVAHSQAPEFKGSEDCRRCHREPLPEDVTDFVTLLESRVHEPPNSRSPEAKQLFGDAQDPHFHSYQSLLAPLGARITNRMGWTAVGSEYDAGSDAHRGALAERGRACLTCHANWLPHRPALTAAQHPDLLKYGIGCEGCHGASSRWTDPHKAAAWRLRPPDEKAAQGMIDVRNPLRRAQQCYSCHIGNAEEQKVLTHAMYAAGHPPLPGIEIESFASQLPRHWRSLIEKGDFEHRAKYLEVNKQLSPGEFPRTRGVLIGAAAALQTSAQLVRDLSSNEDAWPELGALDCQSCHHDLRSPAWRQGPRLGYAAPPGSAAPPSWPLALLAPALGMSLENPKSAAEVQQWSAAEVQKLAGLPAAAYQTSPFGDPQTLSGAMDDLSKRASQLAEAFATQPFDHQGAQRLRFLLKNSGDTKRFDYHSARQFAWALSIVEEELALQGAYPAFNAATKRHVQYAAWVETVRAPVRRRIFSDFAKGLPSLELRLPLRTSENEGYSAELQRSANYAPEHFLDELRKLPNLKAQP